MTYEKLLAAAFEFYGTCLGKDSCHFDTVKFMINEYGIEPDLAEEVVNAAYSEWIEAYE